MTAKFDSGRPCLSLFRPCPQAARSLRGKKKSKESAAVRRQPIRIFQTNARLERLGEHEFRVCGSDIVLSSLCSVRDMTREDTIRQMLFPEK